MPDVDALDVMAVAQNRNILVGDIHVFSAVELPGEEICGVRGKIVAADVHRPDKLDSFVALIQGFHGFIVDAAAGHIHPLKQREADQLLFQRLDGLNFPAGKVKLRNVGAVALALYFRIP